MSQKTVLREFSQELGLNFDDQAVMGYGRYRGHQICIVLSPSSYRVLVTISVTKDGQSMLAEEAKALTKASKTIANGAVSDHRVVFETAGAPGKKKCMEKARVALDEIVTFLTSNGYTDCCQNCDAATELAAYTIDGDGHILCAACFNTFLNSVENNKSEISKKKGSVITGLVGAFLGSLLGVAAIVIVGQLGYVAAISGIIMGVCTLKGYELLGGKLDWLGLALASIVMLVMVYVGNNLDWGIAVMQEFEVSIFEGFSAIPMLISEEVIDIGSYGQNLLMVYIFAALGAYPTIKNAIKHMGGHIEARKAA